MTNINLPPEHVVQQPKKRSKAPMVIAAALAVFLLGGAVTLLFIGSDGVSASKQGDESEMQVDEAGSFSGPEAMSSGGVVFGTSMSPLVSVPGGSHEIVPHSVDRDAGEVDIRVYVDYRCPHCMMFETVNGKVLEEAVSSGATVEIQPLTFMDRVSEGSAYSSRAANLFACTVEHEPESAWLMHSLLLTENVQPGAPGPGHDDELLVEMARSLTGSSSTEYEQCITGHKYVDFVGAVNDLVFKTPVPGAIDSALKVEGTPMILVKGVEYTDSIADAGAFRAFLVEQGVIFD